MQEREQRRKRLTPEQKWQIFLEASRKGTTDAEVCRRWGITPSQLRVIRERVRAGAAEALSRGPGRSRKDPKVVELEAEVERTERALKELATARPHYQGIRHRGVKVGSGDPVNLCSARRQRLS